MKSKHHYSYSVKITHIACRKRKEESPKLSNTPPSKRTKTSDDTLRKMYVSFPKDNNMSDYQLQNCHKNLQILRGIPMKCQVTSSTSHLTHIDLVNFNACFNSNVTKRLRVIEDSPGTKGIIENLALADPSAFQMLNKFLCHHDEPSHTPTRFFLLGDVTNSSLLSGDVSHNISICFSNRSFPRAMAVVGSILTEKALFLPSFQKGVSITTAKRPLKGSSTTPGTNIQGLISSSQHSADHNLPDPRKPLPFTLLHLLNLILI